MPSCFGSAAPPPQHLRSPERVSGSRADPALGLAAGLLFAGGDISAKLVGYGGIWFVAVLTLIVFYALGTSILQGAFQHGDALTGAGLATLATNAIPIAAGFIVFGEQLPAGQKGALQVAAFVSLVISAVFLARVQLPATKPEPGGAPPEALFSSKRNPPPIHEQSL
jgi:hypothetical protein